MDMRMRNIQIQDLVYQNEELRHRLGGFDQLQQCADQLLFKLEGAKKRQLELLSLNDRIKKEANELEREIEHSKADHAEEIRFVISQHDRMFAEKDSHINSLTVEVEKSRTIQTSLKRDLQMQVQTQRQLVDRQERAAQQFEKEIISSERQIKELSDMLRHEKKERVKDEEQFKAVLREEQRVSSRFEDELGNLTTVVKKLKDDNIFLADFTKELERSMAKKGDQDGITIRDLQMQLQQLLEYGKKQVLEKKQILRNNQIITEQLQDSKRLQARLKGENDTLVQEKQRLSAVVRELDQELSRSKDKSSALEEAIYKETRSYKENSLKLIEEHNILNKCLQDTEQLFNTTRTELRETTQLKNTLQSTVTQLKADLSVLSNQHVNLVQRLDNQTNRNKQSQLDKTKQREELNKLRKEYSNLEDLNVRLRNQMEDYLDGSVKNGQYNEHSKQLLAQINKMMIVSKQEREDMLRLFSLQKEKMKESYEGQLREKDVNYLREIAVLREQLNRNWHSVVSDPHYATPFKY